MFGLDWKTLIIGTIGIFTLLNFKIKEFPMPVRAAFLVLGLILTIWFLFQLPN